MVARGKFGQNLLVEMGALVHCDVEGGHILKIVSPVARECTPIVCPGDLGAGACAWFPLTATT